MINFTDIRKPIYTLGATISGSNGFYYEEAPETVTTPYIVYHLIDTLHERISVGSVTEDTLIQFNIIDKRLSSNGKKISSATIETVAYNLINTFDLNILNVSGSKSLTFKRNLTTPAQLVDDDAYWQITVRYNLYVTN